MPHNPRPRPRLPCRSPAIALALSALLALHPHPAHAAISLFRPVSGTAWTTAANWTDAANASLHTVPTPDDYAYFSNTAVGSVSISLASTQSVKGIQLLTGTFLNLNGSNSTPSNLNIGSGGLALANGARAVPFGNIAFNLSTAQSWSTSGNGQIAVTAVNNNGFDLRLNNSTGGAVTLGYTTNGGGGGLSGSGGLTVAGGTVRIQSTGGYTGPTILESGKLSLLTPDALTASPVITFTGGTLAYSGASADYSDKFQNSTSPIVIDPNTTSLTFASPISASNTAGLTLTNASTLTLTADNEFTGTTSITASAAVLQLGNGGTTGSVRGDISNGGAVRFNRSDDYTLANTLSGSGTFQKLGGGKLTLTGNSTSANGTFTVSAGTLQIGDGGTAGVYGGNIALAPETTLIYNRSGNYVATGLVSGSPGTNGSITKLGPGTVQLTLIGAPLTYTGPIRVLEGTLHLESSRPDPLAASALVIDAALIFRHTPVSTATYGGSVSGTGSLTKLGTGVLVFTGPTTLTGLTTVSEGTLQFGNGATTGSISGPIANTAALVFNRTNDLTYPGTLSGSGSLTKLAAGKLTLTANNPFSGTTTISAGTLQLGEGAAAGSLAGPIVNNASLALNRSDDFTLSAVISGTGSVTQLGPGAVTLTNTNSFNGLVLKGGIVAAAADANLGAASATLTSGVGGSGTLKILGTAFTTTPRPISWGGFGGTLDIADPANNFTLAQPFSFFLTKAGPGTLTLTGASTLSNLDIAQGTVSLGNGGTTGSVAGPISNRGTLTFNRSNNYTHTGLITGAGTLSKLAAGTVTFSPGQPSPYAANSLSITAGALNLTTNPLILHAQTPAALRPLVAAKSLFSSSATPNTTLAVFPNSAGGTVPYYATFFGTPVTSTDTLVRLTYTGDTNLDGKLDATDLATALEGYTTARTGWQWGDFNYDGLVNTTDLTLLTTALAANLPPLATPLDLAPPTPPPSGSIPDPHTLLPLASTLPLLRRRR